MAVRNTVNDFIRDVAARTAGSVVYAASINADNVTVKITRNGVATFPKVYWNVQGASAPTDAGGVANYDTVTIVDGSGFAVPCAAQQFINSLV